MTYNYKAIIMFCASLIAQCAVAQDTITIEKDTIEAKEVELEDYGNRILFVKTSNDSTVYKILELHRSKNTNEIKVPHFAIHSANNKFLITLGGQVTPTIGLDLGSDLYKIDGAGVNFIPSKIPITSRNGRLSDLYINALSASVDLQIVGFGNTKDQITGYIKISSGGNTDYVKLDKAYITWRGVTIGLKNSLFQDESVAPPIVDSQGPNGLISNTVEEISYESPSFKGFKFGAGLDIAKYNTSNGIYYGNGTWDGNSIYGVEVCNPHYYGLDIPDIPLYAEWEKSRYNRVRLSGIIRPMKYRDLVRGSKQATLGWGVSLSGNINPIEPIIFYLQATYGKGIGAYIQDLSDMPISFVPNNDKPGRMSATPMMGWLAGMTYNINKKWQANVMASQARVWNVSDYCINQSIEDEINNYKYGYYVTANAFYSVSSYFDVGFEYNYGYRKSWNKGSGYDHRLQFMFQFKL